MERSSITKEKPVLCCLCGQPIREDEKYVIRGKNKVAHLLEENCRLTKSSS